MLVELERFHQAVVHGKEGREVVAFPGDPHASGNQTVVGLEFSVRQWEPGKVVLVEWVCPPGPGFREPTRGERGQRKEAARVGAKLWNRRKHVLLVRWESVVLARPPGIDQTLEPIAQEVGR